LNSFYYIATHTLYFTIIAAQREEREKNYCCGSPTISLPVQI